MGAARGRGGWRGAAAVGASTTAGGGGGGGCTSLVLAPPRRRTRVALCGRGRGVGERHARGSARAFFGIIFPQPALSSHRVMTVTGRRGARTVRARVEAIGWSVVGVVVGQWERVEEEKRVEGKQSNHQKKFYRHRQKKGSAWLLQYFRDVKTPFQKRRGTALEGRSPEHHKTRGGMPPPCGV